MSTFDQELFLVFITDESPQYYPIGKKKLVGLGCPVSHNSSLDLSGKKEESKTGKHQEGGTDPGEWLLLEFNVASKDT